MLAALAAMLAVAAPAQAFQLSSFSLSPDTTVAAAHPNLTIATNFTYADSTDSVRNLQVFFPAGLIGNPSVVAQCSSAQLAADSCPATSQIGTVSVVATAAGIPLPVTAPGSVYSVTPTGSEPARIGMVIRPLGGVLGKASFSGPVSILIPGNASLVSSFSNLPKALPPVLGVVPVPIQIHSVSLTLDGLVDGGVAAFMTNPTSCGPAVGVGAATSYESAATSALLSGFTPTDCPHVPFTPGVAFSFGSTRANTPSALTVTVNVPAADLPRRQSHVLASVALLPLGTAVNPAALGALVPVACTDAQLNVNSAAPAGCAAASQVGTVTFTTPLLGSLPGQVYWATGTASAPLRLFIQVNIHGLYTKFIAVNGFWGPWITSTLSNLPQVPFTSFALSFSGGPTALVDTPGCGTNPGVGLFVPWSGNPIDVTVGSVTITQDATGAPCPAASLRHSAGAARVSRAAIAALAGRLARQARAARTSGLPPSLRRLVAGGAPLS